MSADLVMEVIALEQARFGLLTHAAKSLLVRDAHVYALCSCLADTCFGKCRMHSASCCLLSSWRQLQMLPGCMTGPICIWSRHVKAEMPVLSLSLLLDEEGPLGCAAGREGRATGSRERAAGGRAAGHADGVAEAPPAPDAAAILRPEDDAGEAPNNRRGAFGDNLSKSALWAGCLLPQYI